MYFGWEQSGNPGRNAHFLLFIQQNKHVPTKDYGLSLQMRGRKKKKKSNANMRYPVKSSKYKQSVIQFLTLCDFREQLLGFYELYTHDFIHYVFIMFYVGL